MSPDAPGRPPSGDYRYFVGAFPGGEIAAQIQAVRERHDAKTARITAPHVTMAGTYWRTGPATPDDLRQAGVIDRLEAARPRLAAFELVLGGVESFLPSTAVLYLHVEPAPGLLAARRVLIEALGPDKERRFTPHLTLAMRLGKDETGRLMRDLRETQWHTERFRVPMTELWLMQRGPQDPAWRYIHRIELPGNPT